MSDARQRNHAVPIPVWWLRDARSAAKDRKISQFDLADLVGSVLSEVPSQSQISRCFTGQTTTVELVDAISSILRIPPPVYIARSRTEAIQFLRERQLYEADAEMRAIEREIAEVERPRVRGSAPGTKRNARNRPNE